MYAVRPEELCFADAVILPGSKNTISDLLWLRKAGLADAVLEAAAGGVPVTGICGGYQMMGRRITDAQAVENEMADVSGLGLLPVFTEFEKDKVTRQAAGQTMSSPDLPMELRSRKVQGYEIHMGRSRFLSEDASPFCVLDSGEPDGCMAGSVFGTYLHGLFDSAEFAEAYCRWVARLRGKAVSLKAADYGQYRQEQYDRLADALRRSLDMEYICRIMGLPGKQYRKKKEED